MSNEWLGVALPWGPGLSSFIEPKEDRFILKTSLLFIILTRRGERVMLPEFGSDFLNVVFEPGDVEALKLLDTEIRGAVERWDDRIEIVDFEAIVDPFNAHKIDVRVMWRNAKDPISEETQVLSLTVTPTTISVLGG